MSSVANDGATMSNFGRLGRPRIAVLIPVFNDQTGLERTITSLAADGERFDVVVVDDGSDPPINPGPLSCRLQLIRHKRNQGITTALNAGLTLIAEAGYDYVARLDAGDLSLPGRLSAQMRFLDYHRDHAAVGTAARYVDPGGRLLFAFHPPLYHNELQRFYRYRSGIVHPSAMIRVQALLDCGFYRENFPGGEDYELFVRLSRAYKLGNLSSAFIVKEIRPGSITSRRLLTRMSRVKVLLKYFYPFSIHSYLGIVFNLLLMFAPPALVFRTRRGRRRESRERNQGSSGELSASGDT